MNKPRYGLEEKKKHYFMIARLYLQFDFSPADISYALIRNKINYSEYSVRDVIKKLNLNQYKSFQEYVTVN